MSKALTIGEDAYRANFRTGVARKVGKIIAIRDGITRATDNGTIYDQNSNIQVELLDGSKQWFARMDIFNYDNVVWIGFHIEVSQ